MGGPSVPLGAYGSDKIELGDAIDRIDGSWRGIVAD